MSPLRDRIRSEVARHGIGAEKLHAAILAVLDLTPPRINSGDDPNDHLLLTDGWTTAHHTVLLAIAEALGTRPN